MYLKNRNGHLNFKFLNDKDSKFKKFCRLSEQGYQKINVNNQNFKITIL